MIVVIAAEAERDLEAIGDFIALDNPDRAMSFVRELRASCSGLGEFSARFPIVPGFEAVEVRRRVYGNYAVYYRIFEDHVVVLHVIHGARDAGSTLLP